MERQTRNWPAMPSRLSFQSVSNRMPERRSSLISSTSLRPLQLTASPMVWVEGNSRDTRDGGHSSMRMQEMALMQRTKTGQRKFFCLPCVDLVTNNSAVLQMLRATYSSPTYGPYLQILFARSMAFRRFQSLSSRLFKLRNIRRRRLRCFRSQQRKWS